MFDFNISNLDYVSVLVCATVVLFIIQLCILLKKTVTNTNLVNICMTLMLQFVVTGGTYGMIKNRITEVSKCLIAFEIGMMLFTAAITVIRMLAREGRRNGEKEKARKYRDDQRYRSSEEK